MPVGQALTTTRLRVAAAAGAAAARAARGGGGGGGARGGGRNGRSGRGCGLRRDDLLHQAHDLLGRAGRAQRGDELRPHESAGQGGQQGQVVGVAVLGGGDEERQVGGAVGGAEVDLGREPGECQ